MIVPGDFVFKLPEMITFFEVLNIASMSAPCRKFAGHL